MAAASEGKLAVLEAEMRNHIKNDEAGFKRLEDGNAVLVGMMKDIGIELRSSVERIHAKREEDGETMRKAVAAVAKDAGSAHKRIDGVKIWLLTNVIVGGIMAVSVVAWAWDHFGTVAKVHP